MVARSSLDASHAKLAQIRWSRAGNENFWHELPEQLFWHGRGDDHHFPSLPDNVAGVEGVRAGGAAASVWSRDLPAR